MNRDPFGWRGGSLAPGVVLLIIVLMLMPLGVGLAQETTGGITGTVTDTSGAVIPGVTVTLVNKDTDATVAVQSGASGVYLARNLQPGRYSATFEATGFAKAEIPDVMVLVGRTVQLNVTMEVGQLQEVVQVTEAAPLIDTSRTMIAQNVPAEELARLPKPRSFQAIAIFSPSVNTGQIEGGYQVNGASAAENNYYIDGVSTTSLIDGRARQNAVFEYIQEVQVKTAGLDAEYGGALGGVISAVTKSGGNDFHGEIHYYYYGNRISAGPTKRLQLDPVDEQTVKYVQDDKQKRDYHEFGGSLGGPLIKNKLFFFTSVSPRWQRRTRNYLFDNGETPGSMSRKAHQMSMFNKLSFNPSDRVRTNFTWLYTPQYMTGSLYAYDGMKPNVSTQSLENAKASSTRGYNQPEQSYTGSVDITLTNTSLLSVKGGRYYLNYKEVGIPYQKYYWWRSSSVGLEGVPPELQLPFGYSTPSAAQVVHDTTTRTYVQADYSQFFNLLGQHNLKAGVGTQKNVNSVFDSWVGPLGRVLIYWDRAFTTGERGTYGYYRVDDAATRGSTGANITHLYIQDAWKIHPRLTINVGLRSEKEIIPSFRRDIQEYAFEFGFGDKLSPRIGASFDVFGNGKMKVFGSWGRFYDWTKYDLARGTFGGDVWHVYYRSLDTTDIYSIDVTNMPGRNLWPGGEYRDYRIPGFEYLDPEVKPMSTDLLNFGVEYEIRPQMVFSGRYTRNHLNRTIEDMGALDEAGNEVYRYGNPGEGKNTIAPSVGPTCVIELPSGACGFPMPKAERVYDAMELSLTRRFAGGWLASASYVYSKLWGNYSGLQSTDEIRPPTLGFGFGANQVFGAEHYRPGGNANRYFDLDEAMWDAHGNVGLLGRLPTDRPHVFKFYGAKQFKWGTEVGTFFRVMSGTPVTTQAVTVSPIPFYVEGRGDMGRTPVFSQTDLMVAHEFKVAEGKRLRLEFNMMNLFNQKTSMFIFDRYNREETYETSGMYLYDTDLSKGFDWKAKVLASPDGQRALDPRYGKDAIFNPGFQGRFLIKFIF